MTASLIVKNLATYYHEPPKVEILDTRHHLQQCTDSTSSRATPMYELVYTANCKQLTFEVAEASMALFCWFMQSTSIASSLVLELDSRMWRRLVPRLWTHILGRIPRTCAFGCACAMHVREVTNVKLCFTWHKRWMEKVAKNLRGTNQLATVR